MGTEYRYAPSVIRSVGDVRTRVTGGKETMNYWDVEAPRFAVQQGQKRAHKGALWGMYVRPGARTGGIGRRLIEAILDVARQHVELIQLTVVQDNARARRLYASLGFIDYGTERNALKQNGRYYDEVLMAKDLLG